MLLCRESDRSQIGWNRSGWVGKPFGIMSRREIFDMKRFSLKYWLPWLQVKEVFSPLYNIADLYPPQSLMRKTKKKIKKETPMSHISISRSSEFVAVWPLKCTMSVDVVPQWLTPERSREAFFCCLALQSLHVLLPPVAVTYANYDLGSEKLLIFKMSEKRGSRVLEYWLGSTHSDVPDMNLRNTTALSTDICNKVHKAKGLNPLPFYKFLSALTLITFLFALTVSCACVGCHHQHRKVINVVIVCYYVEKTPVSLILLTKYIYQPNKIPTRLFSFLITLNLMACCCTRLILCITSSLCWSLIHNPSMILLMPRRGPTHPLCIQNTRDSWPIF